MLLLCDDCACRERLGWTRGARSCIVLGPELRAETIVSRPAGIVVALVAALVFVGLTAPKPKNDAYDTSICAGPPLRGVQARNDAMEAGYVIDMRSVASRKPRSSR